MGILNFLYYLENKLKIIFFEFNMFFFCNIIEIVFFFTGNVVLVFIEELIGVSFTCFVLGFVVMVRIVINIYRVFILF